jgi:hypothetical protein
MTLIDSVVNITITRNTIGTSKQEFSTILVIGEPIPIGLVPLFGQYASLDEVFVDYRVDTYEYQMARNIFIQDITVKKIYITQRSNAESLLEAYQRIRLDNVFYAVCTSNDIHADIMPLANAVEASITSGQPNILALLEGDQAVGLTSDMKKTFDAKLGRTMLWYSNRPNPTPPDVTISYMDAAILGRMLPTDPGSNSWLYKAVKGITPDTAKDGGLTNTIIAKINGYNGNFYSVMGGTPATFGGKMASGEFIDIIYGIDWLKYNMQQDVANVFTSSPKIPFTNKGISLIETAMRASLEIALTSGVISSYTLTTPDSKDVSINDKANRELKAVTFQAIATGAINRIIINGFVTL